MSYFLQRIQLYEKILLSAFTDNESVESLGVKISELSKQTSDLSGDLEIAIRNVSLNLHSNSQDKSKHDTITVQINYIKYILNFVLENSSISPNLPKIPFILIEDILEYQTLENTKRIWIEIEKLVNNITDPNFFLKGKFTILKICNSLLRRMSKSCDTEYCGRILMFLAALYPISERSAVNLSGKINTQNLTYYDTQEKFQENMTSFGDEATFRYKIKQEDDAKSKQVKQPIKDEEEGEEMEIEKPSEKEGVYSITYTLYQSFWKLQPLFATDTKSFDNAQYWEDFMTSAKQVIEVFQIVESTSSKELSSSTDNNVLPSTLLATNESIGVKYLTSSQLFLLQLKDPMVRLQIAIQLLIFIHYFKVKAIPSLTEEDKKIKYLKDIQYVYDTMKQIFLQTTGGKDLFPIVNKILLEEEFWINWKIESCPAFEKNNMEEVKTIKRKLDELAISVQETKEKKQTQSSNIQYSGDKYVFDCSENHVKEIVKDLSSCRPTLDDEIQNYLDADDPECGIDDEYHPRHDQVYCWRTRRLLAETDISIFKVMADGDLGRGIRKLKNLPEPEPKPQVQYEDDDFFGNENNTSVGMEIEGESESKEPNDELTNIDIDPIEKISEDGEDTLEYSPSNDPDLPKKQEEPEDGEEVEAIEESESVETKMRD